jgi:hypothetical protein
MNGNGFHSPDLIRGRGRRVSLRTVSLTIASRLVLSAIGLLAAAVTVGSFGVARGEGWEQERLESVSLPAARPRSSTGESARTTPSELLDRLHVVIGGERGRLVDMRLGRPVQARGSGSIDVRLRIDMQRDASSDVARLLSALESAQLRDLQLRAVTPTPGGLRLDVTATAVLATGRLTGDRSDVDRTAVGLTASVEGSGSRLRRLEVPEVGTEAPIVLAADGTIEELIMLLIDLERHHTAPVRFETFRVEALDARHYELAVTFQARETEPDMGSVIR